MSNEELNKVIETATKAVNDAVNPHGFKAVLIDTIDEICNGKETGEVWFTLWYADTEKQKEVRQGYFEAIYYFRPNAELKRGVGAIGFGVMDNDFVDLPDDAAKACAIFDKWSRQMTLRDMIAASK